MGDVTRELIVGRICRAANIYFLLRRGSFLDIPIAIRAS